MGGPASHGLTLGRRGIACTKEYSNFWNLHACIGGGLTDLLQWLGEVFLYIVAQGLERGYVDDLALVGEAPG